MAEFADRALLRAKAGDGGHGCASVHREKFKPLGGPDGGNGGRGGDVILEVHPSMATLLDFHRRPVRRAANGKQGSGSNRNGAAGADLVIRVPDGTVVKTEDGEVLADLVGAGTRYVAAQGGRGGLGNAALASTRRKAPGFALRGEPGTEISLVLELKTVADAGLVGFPNAGKSSLIGALSAAKPKVGDYPFTTLTPHLGMVEAGDIQFVVADVPGLIPGASQGKGLGLDFLRHVERCAVLVHVLDCAAPAQDPDRDPVADYEVIEAELAAYQDDTGADLSGRPRIIALNKIDVPAAREIASQARQAFTDRGLTVLPGLRGHPGRRPRTGLRAGRGGRRGPRGGPGSRAQPGGDPAAASRRPDFEIERTGENTFLVRGDKPWRWVQQTDFSNDEAVGYLADRLAKLGVEEALTEAGADDGAEVLIGNGDDAVVFDWAPDVPAGPQHGRGPRGTDRRLSR